MYARAELVVPRSMPIFIRRLLDFYLRRSDHRDALSRRSWRQIDLFGPPAFVSQNATRRLAADRHVAQKLHGSRIVGLQFGEAAFHRIDYWRQAQIAIQ